MVLDKFHRAPLLPHWQATTKRPDCSRCRSFQAHQFVHQHDAQCLSVMAARWVGMANLGLEFERRVPYGLIKEEQARAQRAASDTGAQIKQRIPKIDVKIRDACQHSRGLPPIEPMPCGNEAELAIELAQVRFWQALDKRLAFMAFGTLVRDQQICPGMKSAFESLAPG